MAPSLTTSASVVQEGKAKASRPYHRGYERGKKSDKSVESIMYEIIILSDIFLSSVMVIKNIASARDRTPSELKKMFLGNCGPALRLASCR